MLQQPLESSHKQGSKRFALKKEVPILKQFRKIYKQYKQKPHPHLIQKEFTKEQVKLAELEVERLSNSQTLNFDIIFKRKIQTDQNKCNNEDSECSPFSQNTFTQDTIKKDKNQKELDFEQLYQIYLEKQFTEGSSNNLLQIRNKDVQNGYKKSEPINLTFKHYQNYGGIRYNIAILYNYHELIICNRLMSGFK